MSDRKVGRPRGTRVVRGTLDLLLLVAIAYVCTLLATSAGGAANKHAQLSIVKSESRALYQAFRTYHERNREYPNSYTWPQFDRETLDPLKRRGYYKGALLANIRNGRVDAYESPDDQGPNREFWIEMSLADDPAVRVVVASSDDAPAGGGRWLEGVFVVRGGVLEPL